MSDYARALTKFLDRDFVSKLISPYVPQYDVNCYTVFGGTHADIEITAIDQVTMKQVCVMFVVVVDVISNPVTELIRKLGELRGKEIGLVTLVSVINNTQIRDIDLDEMLSSQNVDYLPLWHLDYLEEHGELPDEFDR